MTLADARILALNGAVLGDGIFRAELEEAGGPPILQPGHAQLGVITGEDGRASELFLAGNAARASDGFFYADQPVHFLRFHETLPVLGRLSQYPGFGAGAERIRLDYRARAGAAVAWLALNAGFDPERPSTTLLGQCLELSIEAVRSAAGLELILEGRTEPLKWGERQVSPARLEIRTLLSWSTLAARGSRLWWARGMDAQAEAEPGGSPTRLSELNLGYYGGTPYFEGELNLGAAQRAWNRGPWVQALVGPHALMLRPCRQPERRPDGFVMEAGGDGAQLVHPGFGYEAWKRLLGDGTEAAFEQRGPGIGHLDGITGKAVGDEGSRTQAITFCRYRIRRESNGLTVSISGELGELKGYPPEEQLGPAFGVDFFVPSAFLFARGIAIGHMYWEHKTSLEGGDA